MHLTSGVRFRPRFLDVLVLPGSDERAAGFGEDRYVRRSPLIFTLRCESIYQEGSSAPFISGASAWWELTGVCW
ncbi:MAG: hypothetical protein DME23_09670 [Verrucomicrobia bacterium]|nr:MAG: hypothetical protein DME23_09670 [Verrucomicrobiota bacterium]